MLGGTAWAHHANIVAEAVCSGSSVVINYTASSWSTISPEGVNSQIDILFDGNKVDQGAFTVANSFQFSGSKPAPSGPGPYTVTAQAAVNWADGGAPGDPRSVTVDAPESCGGTGRFTGGGSEITVAGIKVTRGLTIHCDLKLSNNLEINWDKGNNFHMTEHLSATCSDDPAIDQKPPVAPLDTLVGTGIGKYNNKDGYSIVFTLVDAGEPGTKDKMAILIFETANPSNVVLNIPLQLMNGGNLQAHFDQPHKNDQ